MAQRGETAVESMGGLAQPRRTTSVPSLPLIGDKNSGMIEFTLDAKSATNTPNMGRSRDTLQRRDSKVSTSSSGSKFWRRLSINSFMSSDSSVVTEEHATSDVGNLQNLQGIPESQNRAAENNHAHSQSIASTLMKTGTIGGTIKRGRSSKAVVIEMEGQLEMLRQEVRRQEELVNSYKDAHETAVKRAKEVEERAGASEQKMKETIMENLRLRQQNEEMRKKCEIFENASRVAMKKAEEEKRSGEKVYNWYMALMLEHEAIKSKYENLVEVVMGMAAKEGHK
eukprot:comp18394_c0_seq1/m.19584 comp18394_c0_seq1/g.19584  ORF comp18394_c0_seq1/g.19584 comp18394_c0_seq1/m.19584 type:complete len:283 (-) comp18394_c0_seq1:66-914(-)